VKVGRRATDRSHVLAGGDRHDRADRHRREGRRAIEVGTRVLVREDRDDLDAPAPFAGLVGEVVEILRPDCYPDELMVRLEAEASEVAARLSSDAVRYDPEDALHRYPGLCVPLSESEVEIL